VILGRESFTTITSRCIQRSYFSSSGTDGLFYSAISATHGCSSLALSWLLPNLWSGVFRSFEDEGFSGQRPGPMSGFGGNVRQFRVGEVGSSNVIAMTRPRCIGTPAGHIHCSSWESSEENEESQLANHQGAFRLRTWK